MRAFAAQTQLLLWEHLRLPAYITATIGFPTIFFLIFAVPEARTEPAANMLLASFLGFAILGVMFLQFAHGLAEERSHPWYTYLRTLPVGSWNFFFSRMAVTGVVALLTSFTLTAVAVFLTPVSLSFEQWLQLYTRLVLGGLSFAVMGMALGMWVSERVALPLGNLIYLPLSYAGGLWKPPELLPQAVRDVSVYLPTRAYGEWLWSAVGASSGLEFTSSELSLVLWTLLFALIAAVGYRWRRI